MKNFTNNFKHKTNPLWIRLLIMTFMLLIGTGSAWGWNKLVIWKSGGNSSEVEFNDGTAQITLSETADYYFYINDNGNKRGLTSTEIKTSSNCKNMSFSGIADCGLRVASGETGLFTFTINGWNGSTPTVSVQYPSASTYLMGLGDWDNGKELPCTISLNAGTYEFKIKKGDTWYGNSGTMTSENSKNWKFDSDNNCQITINESGNYYFYVVWADNLPTVSVTYPCEPSNNNEIRIECVHTENPNLYAWDTSGNLNDSWPGSTISYNSSDNIYYKEFTNTNSTESINIIFSNNGDQKTNDITGLEWGKVYRYTRDGELIYSYCLPPDCEETKYNISFADNATSINKDATVLASVSPSGTEYGTISWSSDKTSIATISSTGLITGEKGGKATITATIADSDTYCGGTATEEITVKETPTIDITGDSYGCNENKTLIATVTGLELGTGYTIKWYKENVETEAKGTGPEYTATESGTYIAQVTGDYINDTSDEFVFTKYPATPVPQITLASNSICAGSTTTLTIDFYDATNYSYKLYNGNNVVGSPVFNNGVYTLSSAGNYYVTATPISGVCQVESAKQQTAATLTVTSVTLELNPTSAPVCSSATIADISTYVTATTTVTPSGTASVNWYASEGATTALTDETELEAKTYYAEAATTSGCKSGRKPFEVTSLMTAPSKPVITPSNDAICSGNAVTLTLETKVAGETYTIGNTDVFTGSNTWSSELNTTTDYIVKATNSCGSTDSEELTINVTTTPTITGPSATQPNKEITLSSAAGANTMWETSSGSTLTPAKGAETVFTATGNGNYTITASNTANNITCSATHEIVVNDKFYIYIRRPKSGTTTYNQWYEKTNDADKGAHPWMKNGSEYKTGDDYTNNNYDGYGPESTFTDCNGYVWDAFIAPGTSFFIHAPNTFQEGGQEGYATFTQVTNITSTATDLYYTINQWAGGTTKGTTLSPASEPNRIPEVAVPVLSIDPVSGIICQGAEATITVTNPENGVSYKLNYEGKDQTNSIAYTGTGNVEFAVTEAGTYLVKAETTSGTCKGNAISIAREIQVITTSIAFVGAPYVTTPWEPITITVNIPKGYNYTFNDTQLTQIASPDTPIKKVSGSEYTYSFPRPQEWGTGNSQTGDSWGEKSYTISATLNGVTESCGTTTATVKLQDEGNDNCNP